MLIAEDRTCGGFVVFSRVGKDVISYGITSCSAVLSTSRRSPSCRGAAMGCFLPELLLVSHSPSREGDWSPCDMWGTLSPPKHLVHFGESIFLIKQCLLRLLSIRRSFLRMSRMLPDREQSNFSQTAWTKWKSLVGFDSSLSDKQLILLGLVNPEKSLLSTCTGDQMLVRLPVQ